MMDNYEDIINHPHHVSIKHAPMSLLNRAAQFSPFAALTGYEDAIDETARLTDVQHEMTEEELDGLNNALQMLLEMEVEQPLVSVTYFKPDERKCGGSYVTVTGNFRFLDMMEMKLKFTDGTEILLSDLYKIEFTGGCKSGEVKETDIF